MADDKTKVTDKAGEIAKNIWLAGVGAYGRAVDEAQGRMEKAGVEPPKLFRDLVKAGAALEEEARGAIEAGQAARSSVEERIQRARDNFNMQRPVRGEDLLALHEKIDRIEARLDILMAALAEGAATSGTKRKAKPTAPAKKTAARAKSRTKAKTGATTGTRTKAKTQTKAKPSGKSAEKNTPARRSAAARRSR